MRKRLSFVLAIFIILLCSVSAFADGRFWERMDEDYPFSLELKGVENDYAIIELVSVKRLESFVLGIQGSKVTIRPTSSTFEIPLQNTYTFDIHYQGFGVQIIYNGIFSFREDDNGDIQLVMEALACNEISVEQDRSSGIINESEPNNTYGYADPTYDDKDNYGAISTTGDADWWVVSFLEDGSANFWLGNVPSGCDYDIRLYACDGSTQLDVSVNSGNRDELITYPVIAGENYYIKISSYSGSSSAQYLFRTKNYPAVVVNRVYSTYEDTVNYRDYFEDRMNCYGYAIHVYSQSKESLFVPYKQQPGEFAEDSQTYGNLDQEYNAQIHGADATGQSILDYVEGKIHDDFDTLYSDWGLEWSIYDTDASAIVPVGYRKIALAVGVGQDFHFYMRHSDGTWSHKPGGDPVTNLSIDTQEEITDSNISVKAREGGYDDGVRYYLIKKSAVIDYMHQNGHGSSTTYTSPAFLDCAGDTITMAAPISGTSKAARFDYPGDIDWYQFTPTITATYTFTTSLSSSAYDVDMTIINSAGYILAHDSNNYGNPSISVTLVANETYYIEVDDVRDSEVSYTLYYTR